jgi:hypothetical protein
VFVLRYFPRRTASAFRRPLNSIDGNQGKARSMQRDQLIGLVDQALCPVDTCDAIPQVLGSLDHIVAWCEARRLQCASVLAELNESPEHVLASSSRTSLRQADKVMERTRTIGAAPQFGQALADGNVSTDHVDQLSHALRRLEPDQRERLIEDAPELLNIASSATPDEFAKALRRAERRLAADDGMALLQRQRKAVRLRWYVDPDLGMHHWRLSLDPISSLALHERVAAVVETLFHTDTPEGCPTDPLEKQGFLRAHALLRLINNEEGGVQLARPEAVYVIDTRPATGPVVDCGIPVEIPERAMRDLLGAADPHVVIVRNGVVLHAPGETNLGRSTRLASRAQRRTLRALYATCAVPGCATRFHNCTIHHIVWWRHGGNTDLDNLLPLCSRHHHKVHDSGWQLQLGADRSIVITLPDGSTMTNGPPGREAT